MIEDLRIAGAAALAAFALSACAAEGPAPPAERPAPEPSAPVAFGTDAAATQSGWPFLAEAPANCFEQLGGTNASPTQTTLADAVKAPLPVEYESEAFVVFRGACHFGAKMRGKNCRPFVVLSDTRYAGIKSAMSPSMDLVLFVDDSSKWEQFSQHQVRYGLCSFEPGALAARVIGAPAGR